MASQPRGPVTVGRPKKGGTQDVDKKRHKSRYPDLILPYRHLAWQLSIRIDTSTTLLLNRCGLQQGLSFRPRGTGAPRVALVLPQGLVDPGNSPLRDDASRYHPGSTPLGPPQLRWRRHALEPPEVLRDNLAGNTCTF